MILKKDQRHAARHWHQDRRRRAHQVYLYKHPSLEKDDAEPKNNGTPEKGKNPGATRHMQMHMLVATEYRAL